MTEDHYELLHKSCLKCIHRIDSYWWPCDPLRATVHEYRQGLPICYVICDLRDDEVPSDTAWRCEHYKELTDEVEKEIWDNLRKKLKEAREK